MGEVQAEAEHWAGVEPHHGEGCWWQGVQEQAQRWEVEDATSAAQHGPPQGEKGAEAAGKAALKAAVRT